MPDIRDLDLTANSILPDQNLCLPQSRFHRISSGLSSFLFTTASVSSIGQHLRFLQMGSLPTTFATRMTTLPKRSCMSSTWWNEKSLILIKSLIPIVGRLATLIFKFRGNGTVDGRTNCSHCESKDAYLPSVATRGGRTAGGEQLGDELLEAEFEFVVGFIDRPTTKSSSFLYTRSRKGLKPRKNLAIL